MTEEEWRAEIVKAFDQADSTASHSVTRAGVAPARQSLTPVQPLAQ
jgi:hypothetical protein